MTRQRTIHLAVAGGGFCLAVALALFIVRATVAQGQLPGTRLTTSPAHDLRPAWSPDGTQIAFFSNRTDSNDIWVMDADGENQRELTYDSADDRRPAWSPDGTRIAFDSDRSGSRDIWIMDSDGGNVQQLTDDPGQETFPSWSPDGSQIAYYAFADGVTDLWLVNADGQDLRRLTNGLADERSNQCTFACHMPAWSPDGTQLAYQAMNHTQVWVVEVDGSDPHPLTAGHEHEHFPSWTPDGRILFLVERTNDRQEPVNDVWVIDADGQNPSLLFEEIPHGGPLEFRPDAATIAFHSPRAGNFDIYTSVLGQEAPPAAEVAPPAEATSAPATEPTALAEAAPAPAPDTTAAPGDALGVVAIAVIAVAGVLIAVFLTRRGRST